MSWEAPEYSVRKKSTDWYWWVGLFAVILLGFALWQRSFLFGVFVAIAWFTMMLYAVRPPKIIRISITNQGVMVEDALHPWTTIKSFWIFHRPPLIKDLSLESKKTFMPYIKIPLGETDALAVKKLISTFIPEVEQKESIADNLSHLAGF